MFYQYILMFLLAWILVSESIGVSKWMLNRMSKNKKERTYFQNQAEIGIKKGLSECRRQFRWERWNCMFTEKVKTKILKRRYIPKVTREMSFVSAMTSASVALELVEVCQRGQAKICFAPFFLKKMLKHNWQPVKHHKKEAEKTDFGLLVTKYFTSIKGHHKVRHPERIIAMQHNNKIGKNVLKLMAQRSCKCYGPSGLCTLKSCLGKLPTRKQVGSTMKYFYKFAQRVKTAKNMSFIPANKSANVDLKDVLVYLTESPSYCEASKGYSARGTLGRVCRIPQRSKMRISDKDHCDKLCHSCGYQVKYEARVREERCDCKFIWCCQVNCKTCRVEQDVIVCRKK